MSSCASKFNLQLNIGDIYFIYIAIIICSDGMGRTGVFITVMSEIERVKIEGEIDTFQTIKSMRTKRPKMVSTLVSILNPKNYHIQTISHVYDCSNILFVY